ncbi:hypothetical protein ScPMuIL_005667 [Solemya velum]
MFKSRDPYWQTVQKPFHLLTVLQSLISHLTDNPTIIPSYERLHFSTVCLDAVASYLVELQATSSTSSQVRVLVHHFKSLQSKLERM